MTQKTVKKRKHRRLSVASIVLIVGIVVIMIPVFIFGYLLYGATMGTGKPLFGSRFTNDLNPPITAAQVTSVQTAIKELPGVEADTVNLKSATLRISVDTIDTLDEAGVKALTTKIYETIETVVPVATYFIADDAKKMYDLEISVYNLKDGKDKPNYFYFIITKNAKMLKWEIQEVSIPLNPALAQQLRDALNKPAATPTSRTFNPLITMRIQEGLQPSFTL